MTDPKDKNLNNTRDNFNVDLDAMLDEAESFSRPTNAQQDDEDSIDRLLINADFDEDDAFIQAEANKNAGVAKEIQQHDELDDFLSFDGFEASLNEPEMLRQDLSSTAAVETVESEQAVENSSSVPFNNQEEDDEDDLDRLLMSVDLDEDDALVQPDVSGTEELDPVEESLSAPVEDELDDFFGLSDDFDEADMIRDDEAEASVPVAEDLIASTVIETSGVEADAGLADELGYDEIEDSADSVVSNKPITDDADDLILGAGFDSEEALEQTDEKTEELENVADLAAEDDSFVGYGDDFDVSDLIQGDENETSAESVAINETETLSNDADVLLAGAGVDFEEALEQTDEKTEELENVADLAAEDDSFVGYGDDFDVSDLIQGDENETSAESVAINETETLSNDADVLLAGAGVDFEEALEQTDEKTEELENVADLAAEDDSFVGYGDDFDVSDLIQDDENETSAESVATNELLTDEDDGLVGYGDDSDVSDLIQDDEDEASADLIASSEQQKSVDDESFNNLQDDENSFDSLFADAGFDAEDALGQAVGKNDAIGDDSDLSEIDDFFQLDEVSDDFSKQIDKQLAEAGDLSTEEDDFLLPDFDITADMDISEIGDDAGIQVEEEDEFADAFGDTDFLNEDITAQASEPKVAEQQPSVNETITESKPKQTADTVIENIDDVKLSPFGFEQEDIKKQLKDAENKVKKAKIFSYVALGFGAVALSAAAGLGVMTYRAKAEVSKLTEAFSTLESDLAKSAANSPSEEVDAMRSSVVELNQQVDGFMAELKGDPKFSGDLLSTKLPDIVAKQALVSKALNMLQVKIGDLEVKASLAPPDIALPKLEVAHESAVKEENTQEHESTKEAVAHEHPSAKEVAAQEHMQIKEVADGHKPTKENVADAHAPTKERAKHVITPVKVETAPEVEPATKKIQPKTVEVKPIIPKKAIIKQKSKKVLKQESYGIWGVNLIAFNQEWFAKSQAAEFARKGIFAEVVPVRDHNKTMYRLRVGGFKSKAEAVSNTARIKKALNLDNVWVSNH